MKIAEIRRENLRAQLEIHGTTGLAAKLGYRQPSFLSQMAGPNPTRDVTEKSARGFEEKLGLDEGYFDKPRLRVESAADNRDNPENFSDANIQKITDMLTDVIRLVGDVLQSEDITLPSQRFADFLTLAVADTMEHNGVPRESYIQQMAKLLK